LSELRDAGLISVSGPDAAPFLHAQLTSDVLGMRDGRIQYGGYCSPKGRLLATLILWRTAEEILLQLPALSADSIRTRLAKYVLRSRVTLADASERFRLYGVVGEQAQSAAAALVGGAPVETHDIVSRDAFALASLSARRSLLISPSGHAHALGGTIDTHATAVDEWARMDIEDGVPWITPATSDRFVPQMVNLDLIGGVSFTKGCYPGQEIVARMHYLGRLKQRMYRLRMPAGSIEPRVGEPLFSPRFGPEQACGTLVNVAHGTGDVYEALAVIQTESVDDGAVHWDGPAGPKVEFLPLPYLLPA
jgi:tRNA-modifying protein YgfZ